MLGRRSTLAAGSLPSHPSAFDRAVQAWKEAALHVRGDLRRNGYSGPLRTLDTRVQGTRGIAAPARIYHDALELARCGASESDVLTSTLRVVAQTIALAYQEARSTDPKGA